MTITEGAFVQLGDCTKGTDYVPDAITLRLNGAIYPSFASFSGIEGKVRKNDANGAVVTSTFTISNAALAQIIPCQMSDTTTAALDCERLWWSCKGTNGSGDKVPLCWGVIRVKPEATY